MVKVSVVVPLYNAGTCLDTCVDSVLRQSLPPDDVELVMVDDGSTDGTAERADLLARNHPSIRVIHIPRSGGPGRPRNVGADAARGEYVYFLDQDDHLAPRGLERMLATALRCDSDIVIGKVVGHGGRGVPSRLFRASHDQADVLADHLLAFLTPHKLFRTEFLRTHGLRFPEGAAWLEDHRMVVRAYFLAKAISVVADEMCCHWVKVPGRSHHSARRFDPRAYYQAVREVLDIVDAYTSPGDERDRFYAHWYHGKMLRLIKGPTLLGLPVRYRQYAHYREIRRLAQERFSPAVDRWLTVSTRVRAHLLRRNAYGDIARLAAAERGITMTTDLESVSWDGADLVLSASAHLVYADGRPVVFRRVAGRLLWIPPCRLRTPVPDETLDVTDTLDQSRLEFWVRDRETTGDYLLPSRSVVKRHVDGVKETIGLRTATRLDPRTAKLGSPLDGGTWDLFLQADCCGWGPRRRLGRPGGVRPSLPSRAYDLGDARLIARPYWTQLGNLSLRVDMRRG
jgi:hypothetical protein